MKFGRVDYSNIVLGELTGPEKLMADRQTSSSAANDDDFVSSRGGGDW
jgi:hypothetical protein